MGGFLSGRPATRRTIESSDACILSISDLTANGLKCGIEGVGSVEWPNGVKSELHINTFDDVYPFLTLSHRARDESQMTVTYSIDLLRSRPHFGGGRWWFRCPSSGTRVANLYLPEGAAYFSARQVYRLTYDVQRESLISRLDRKQRKLLLKLGDDSSGGPRLARPKGMHLRNYICLLQEVEELSIRRDQLVQQMDAVMLARIQSMR